MARAKEPIRLRRRRMASGRESLFLDVYINGVRSYEFLKMYLIPEKTKEDREKNRQTLALAEAVRSKRVVELQNNRFGFEKIYKEDTVFLDYFRYMCEERLGTKESRGNWGNWYSCLQHLEIFITNRKMTFRDVTPEWVEAFKHYLDKKAVCQNRKTKDGELNVRESLSQNSKVSYFNKLRACLNHAHSKRIIPFNPMDGISGFPQEETEREYLTIEELRAMTAAPCRYPALKEAFLFSCLTGLRKCDIMRLRWQNVVQQGEFTRVIFRQKKTKSQEYLDINAQAVRYMGQRGKPEELVFRNFRYNSNMNTELRMWALRAGVMKEISFHCARHTFAVLMLDLGADIYTVQKLLGHKEIQTTQIYAKLMDKKKQEAVSKIPQIEGL